MYRIAPIESKTVAVYLVSYLIPAPFRWQKVRTSQLSLPNPDLVLVEICRGRQLLWFGSLPNRVALKNAQLLSFGFHTKKGKVVTSWKRRFFILTAKNLSDDARPVVISIFLAFDHLKSKCLGAIPLREVKESGESTDGS